MAKVTDERRAQLEAEERERHAIRQRLERRRRGGGGNVLAWLLVIVVLLFVFGIARCGVNVEPEAVTTALR